MIIAYLLTSFVFYFGLMALFAAHNPIFSMICCLVFILCHKHFRLVQNIKISAIRSKQIFVFCTFRRNAMFVSKCLGMFFGVKLFA